MTNHTHIESSAPQREAGDRAGPQISRHTNPSLKKRVTLTSQKYGAFDLDDLVDRLCHSHAPQSREEDLYNAQVVILKLADLMRQDETEAKQPTANSVITYDVVAYNASWGGYGDNASKDGFTSADEAITYAKSCGSHLDAEVWQHTKPKYVEPQPSIKIWSAKESSSAL